MMIKGIAHVCIGAKNLLASERFYCEGLGFSKTFDFLRDDDRFGFYLQIAKGQFLEIFRQEAIDNQSPAAIRHLCLETASIDKVAKHLTGLGYVVSEKKLGADQSWQAWTTDPSGVRIELHEYTEKSSQLTGTDCVMK